MSRESAIGVFRRAGDFDVADYRFGFCDIGGCAMTTKDGGPAFPHVTGPYHTLEHPGLSLRDWFAGMALQGIIASGLPRGAKLAAIANEAYAAAAAMLAEREKRGP